MLSSELILLILPHLSRDSLILMSLVNKRLHQVVNRYFHGWATHLLSTDNYFAQLEISEVIRYLRCARVTFVPDKRVKDSTSSARIGDKFHDVPKIIGLRYEGDHNYNTHAEDKIDNLYILGVNNFFSVRTGEIFDVADVQERDADSYHLLMKDGTVLVASNSSLTKISGCYRRISFKYALTRTGELIDISNNKHEYDFDLSNLPKVIDFDYSDTGEDMFPTLSYITWDKEAWSWREDRSGQVKLLPRAKKLVCSDQETYVLNEDNEVHSFFISDYGEEMRGPIVKDVVDIQRRYHGGYDDEIALILKDEVNICNTHMIRDHSRNRYESRLRQKLFVEGGKYVIDY